MIGGQFELTLSCDEAECSVFQAVFAPTRMEAIGLARAVGWLIRKSGRCLCPIHAAVWREHGYRQLKGRQV